MKWLTVEYLSSLLIRPEFSGDDPWNEYFKRRVEQFETDWEFLYMLRAVICQTPISSRWHRSLMRKINISMAYISADFFVQDEDRLSKPKLVRLMDDSQRTTDKLKSMIRKTPDERCNVGYLSASFDSPSLLGGLKWLTVRLKDLILKLQAICDDSSSDFNIEQLKVSFGGLEWLTVRKSLILKLQAISNDSSNDFNIEQLKVLINSLQELILCGQFIEDVKWYLYRDSDPPPIIIDDINAFLNHVRSLAVRIAIHSCNCWFSMSRKCRKCNTLSPLTDLAVSKKFSRLVDLHYQIDPINPEFLELNLIFLKAISDFSPRITRQFFSFDDDFLRSILGWKGDYEFKGQMMHLLAIVITSKLDYSRDDVQTFFAEIRAVLDKAASLSGPSLGQGNEPDPPPSLSELYRNICLLKAEYFLKYHLQNTNFHDEEFKLGISSEYLLKPHATADSWKHSLALIKDVEDKVASLCQSYSAKECSISMLKNSLLQLLLEIVIFKAEFFLLEFLKSNVSAMSHEKVQVESLLEQLKVFHLILSNMLKEDSDKVEIVLTHIEAIARKITLFSYSFSPNTITEEMLAFPFSELLDKAQQIKAELKEISPIPVTHNL